MKQLLLGGLTAAGVLLGGLALTSAGVSATTTNTNDAAYWQTEGTTCIKHDVGSGDFADSSSDGSAVTLKAPAPSCSSSRVAPRTRETARATPCMRIPK